MKRTASVVALLALFGCQDGPTPPAPRAIGAPSAAVIGAGIPGQYIVQFTSDVTDVHGLAQALIARHGGTLKRTYTHAIKGFSATLPPGVAAVLAATQGVALVEEDQV